MTDMKGYYIEKSKLNKRKLRIVATVALMMGVIIGWSLHQLILG